MFREWAGDKRKFCQEIPTSRQDQTWMGPNVQESYNIYPALQFFYRDWRKSVFFTWSLYQLRGNHCSCGLHLLQPLFQQLELLKLDFKKIKQSRYWDVKKIKQLRLWQLLAEKIKQSRYIDMLTSLCWEDQTCSKAFLIKLTDSLVDASSSSLYSGARLVQRLCKIIFSIWL